MAPPTIAIRPMTPEDWPEVRRIYLEGISTGNATFENDAPSWEKWDVGHLAVCRLVAYHETRVVGWAALSPISSRPVYRGVMEVSVYVTESARGKAVGKGLLHTLIQTSEQCGIWTLQAGIFPENVASIALHRSLRFREIGRRERIGKMKDRWRDVILLERRSAVAGV
jgi:L-amino acid N-acyltransferase YncA